MNLLKIFLIRILIIYQLSISPFIGKNCRYIPTCSEYMILSLKKWNIFKSIFMTVNRIIRCNPFISNEWNYDPPE
ncbi:membrane protein insertion efficiency factor YidD [Blattabacterium cuenoti]|uniref:membrane protein insertion efficiency factor YidD n=1 Tax=Blattabacterium cuenoti TaxID=1653831 RepID=UPI00163CEF99|nr:membrane protein insertion efficiency factor YidD [Blattabacterium cuenoti]